MKNSKRDKRTSVDLEWKEETVLTRVVRGRPFYGDTIRAELEEEKAMQNSGWMVFKAETIDGSEMGESFYVWW